MPGTMSDVYNLERLSWARLYYDLLNRREVQLAKEQTEAKTARLRYEAEWALGQDLRIRVADLREKLAAYANVDAAYDALIQDKTGVVIARQDDRYQQYVAALSAAEKQLSEVSEARFAGLQAERAVGHLIDLLAEATSLGNWDMFTNSSVMSYLKYNKLDNVRDQSRVVSQSIQWFQSELADIQLDMTADWQVDGFTRFVDIFFDNIFTDLSVQRRITKAYHDARMLGEHIAHALRQVEAQLANAQAGQEQRVIALRTYLEEEA